MILKKDKMRNDTFCFVAIRSDAITRIKTKLCRLLKKSKSSKKNYDFNLGVIVIVETSNKRQSVYLYGTILFTICLHFQGEPR